MRINHKKEIADPSSIGDKQRSSSRTKAQNYLLHLGFEQPTSFTLVEKLDQQYSKIPFELVASEKHEGLFESSGYYAGMQAGWKVLRRTLGEKLNHKLLMRMHAAISQYSHDEVTGEEIHTSLNRTDIEVNNGFAAGLTEDGAKEYLEQISSGCLGNTKLYYKESDSHGQVWLWILMAPSL